MFSRWLLLVGVAAALVGPSTLAGGREPDSPGWWPAALALTAAPFAVVFMLWLDPGGRRSARNRNTWFVLGQAWIWSWSAISLFAALALGLGLGRITGRVMLSDAVDGWDAMPFALGVGAALGLIAGHKLFDFAPADT